MFYVKTFLISAPLLGLFYHWVTIEPMPWWPDTVVFGAFMGAMATLIAMNVRHSRRAVRHVGKAARVSREWWRRLQR